VPALWIDIEVLVVCESASNIEFCVKKDIPGVKIDFDNLFRTDRENFGTDSEAVRPQHTADENFYIHDIAQPMLRAGSEGSALPN
jgi:hypothetical protein